jgi:hypothetical protein
MAININSFKTFIEMIANKPQSGFPFSIKKFNEACKYAQIEYFNKLRKQFGETEDNVDMLSPFIVSSTLPIDNYGHSQYPDDYVNTVSTRSTYYKDNVPKFVDVKFVRNSEIGNVLSSAIINPTKRYPVLTYYDTYIQFYPKDLGYVTFDYLRLPTDPIWAYTTVNNRPVYDPTNSVDFEFLPEDANEIAFMVCSYMGSNMREPALVQYSEVMKQQNQG